MKKENNSLLPFDNNLSSSLPIPEPTRSLLWVSDEDPSKYESPFGIKINIEFTENDENKSTPYNEPSLIWLKLRTKKNNELHQEPLYYPEYSRLNTKQRFQYLNWLKDIKQETNLSYVFLYFYGLERHLLIGDYEKAVSEIIILLKSHSKGSFIDYAINSLITASLYKKRFDIVDKAPFLLKGVTNEALLLRKEVKSPLQAEDLIKIASISGFKNKRYIKAYPILFIQLLQKNIDDNNKRNGYILESIELSSLKKEESIVFANPSIPSNIRAIKLPMILYNENFCVKVKSILEKTHNQIKERNKNTN